MAVVSASPPVAPDLRGLRVIFAASVVVLVLLALATLASPVILPSMRGEQMAQPETGKILVLATPGEWILQYNLQNPTQDPHGYTFDLAVPETAGAPPRTLHTSSVSVGAGRQYVFIFHVRPEQVAGGSLRFTVYRGGDAKPLEDMTLHLPPAGSAG